MPRKNKVQERCAGLRAMWQLPSVYQTLEFLGDKLNLTPSTIQAFEECLLSKESDLLGEIFTQLLRFLTDNTNIIVSNFENHLCDLIKSKPDHNLNFSQDKLSDLTPEDRVLYLKWLLDEVLRVKDEELSDYLNENFSPNDLRPITVGQDAFNNTYWYFGDQRLYRETSSSKAGKKDWQTVCVTLKDWNGLLKHFRKTTNTQEIQLVEYLSNELFPLVRAQLESFEVTERSCSPSDNIGELSCDMLKETDCMPNETIGNDVKCELDNVKLEMKEEVVKPIVNSESEETVSNQLPNGDTDVKPKLENGVETGVLENKKVEEKVPAAPPDEPPVSTPVLPNNHQPTPTSQQTNTQPPISMEAPFMQQQSQIFVFSTGLANRAAECVMQGQYKSILAFHTDQPGTKKILQKHPLKLSQFKSSAPLFNMANMRPHHMNMMKNDPRPRMPGANPNSTAAHVDQWVQQQNANLQEQGMNFPPMNPGYSPTHMQGPDGPMSGNFPMMTGNPSFDMFMDGAHNAASANLLQSKVPNENLTPEQLHRREEQLANLRKIQQMLFPEQQRHQQQQMFGPGGPGMMPGNMPGGMFQQNMMASQQNMAGQPGMMMSPGPMSPQNNMMSQQQYMMSQNMPQFGPGPGQQPLNMQNMSPAQREWIRLQQEFMMDKGRRMRHHHIAQHMMQHPSQGPPPSYLSSIAHKRHGGPMGMNDPTSPNNNGPLASPQMAQDPQDPMGMFGGPHPHRPSMEGLEPPMGMNPGMQSPMGPFEPGMMPGQVGGNMGHMPTGQFHNGMPASRKMLGHLHRAGNPEQFQPEAIMGVPGQDPNSLVDTSGNKPPPSYAQAQKRKRDDMEELYKNLQPTPSPQQMNYLNQFEGQELTITKQLNSAYHEQNSNPESQNNHFPHNQSVNSPLHGPGSNKSPMAVGAHGANPGALGSPSMSRANPSPLSGASMRLSHYDPPAVLSPNNPSKPALSNITSASLANLAKGVEHLSNQMQQNMMQGGPFHSIQIQGQMAGNSVPGVNPPSSTPTNGVSQTPVQPSVNNTFVNANLSIQQLNIQSVNAPSNYNPSMQVQQMNHENSAQPNLGIPPMGAVPSQSGAIPGMPLNINMSQCQSSVQTMPQRSKAQFPNPPDSQIPSTGSLPSVPSSKINNNSPSFPPQRAVGNANVQIQPKAPNTIQYLPANPPATQANQMEQAGMVNPGGGMPASMNPGVLGNPMAQMSMANMMGQPAMSNSMLPNASNLPPSKRHELEFMSRFAAPLTNLEGKIPTSKINYMGNNTHNPGMQAPRMVSPYSNPNQAIQAMQQQQQQQQQMMMRNAGPHPNMSNHNGMTNMGHLNNMSGALQHMGNPMGPLSSPGGMNPSGNMNVAGVMPHMTNGMNPLMSAGASNMASMNNMNNGMSNMNNGMSNMNPMGSVPFNNNQSFSPGGGQPQMMNSMMQAQQMQFQSQRMSGMPMQGSMMPRQANPGAMRMSSPPQQMMQPPGGRNMAYNAQFQQFQQQMYNHGRTRQMSPLPNMMGNSVQPYMDMMPNMPGPT